MTNAPSAARSALQQLTVYLISPQRHEVVVTSLLFDVLHLPLLKVCQCTHLPTVLHHKFTTANKKQCL